MKISYLSITREAEYSALKDVVLDGRILDVGGGRKSEYQSLIKGTHNFYSINIDENAEPDAIVDIEFSFPLESNTFDHAICMNVLEHVFEFENVISETLRVVKLGGIIVIATPMMHKIHGSPDDYLRYTESAYRRMAQKYNMSVESIQPLGMGFFSLGMQLLRAAIPSGVIWIICKHIAKSLDSVCNTLLPGFKNLSKRIPLGYVVIFRKR